MTPGAGPVAGAGTPDLKFRTCDQNANRGASSIAAVSQQVPGIHTGGLRPYLHQVGRQVLRSYGCHSRSRRRSSAGKHRSSLAFHSLNITEANTFKGRITGSAAVRCAASTFCTKSAGLVATCLFFKQIYVLPVSRRQCIKR